MSKEWLENREHALENEYFSRKDRDLIERLREQRQRERNHQAMKERLGDLDDTLVTALEEAGFRPDSLAVVHLVPLVEVAWADGTMEEPERQMILALAARRGIDLEGETYAQLTRVLSTPPTDTVLDAVYGVLRTLEVPRLALNQASADDIVAWATKVAEATGGILGMAAVSSEERACLAHIAERLHSRR